MLVARTLRALHAHAHPPLPFWLLHVGVCAHASRHACVCAVCALCVCLQAEGAVYGGANALLCIHGKQWEGGEEEPHAVTLQVCDSACA
ncbi:hypothetical protein EON67_02155 [archaeon]|nr:MAG: hypothetical protein EON67_02155 [archaeon]